jgi:hypothetical protein|tara:strand:+ start:1059 stop:1181 length:123 start_codon:yes stop_codon:yes gene_type:complete
MDYYIVIIDEQILKLDRDDIGATVNDHVDIRVIETLGPSS